MIWLHVAKLHKCVLCTASAKYARWCQYSTYSVLQLAGAAQQAVDQDHGVFVKFSF